MTRSGLVVCAAALAALSDVAGANIIVNGDFETSGLGPSTSAYASTDIYLPAQYLITTHDTVHNAWVDCYDHTFGNGNGHYMAVNGMDDGPGPTWAQTVAVTPPHTAPAALGEWQQRSVTFTTGPTTMSISVQIWDFNQAFTGNDYAIDDISLTPTPGEVAMMDRGGLALLRRRR